MPFPRIERDIQTAQKKDSFYRVIRQNIADIEERHRIFQENVYNKKEEKIDSQVKQLPQYFQDSKIDQITSELCRTLQGKMRKSLFSNEHTMKKRSFLLKEPLKIFYNLQLIWDERKDTFGDTESTYTEIKKWKQVDLGFLLDGSLIIDGMFTTVLKKDRWQNNQPLIERILQNKYYNPNRYKEITERHGSSKGTW